MSCKATAILLAFAIAQAAASCWKIGHHPRLRQVPRLKQLYNSTGTVMVDWTGMLKGTYCLDHVVVVYHEAFKAGPWMVTEEIDPARTFFQLKLNYSKSWTIALRMVEEATFLLPRYDYESGRATIWFTKDQRHAHNMTSKGEGQRIHDFNESYDAARLDQKLLVYMGIGGGVLAALLVFFLIGAQWEYYEKKLNKWGWINTKKAMQRRADKRKTFTQYMEEEDEKAHRRKCEIAEISYRATNESREDAKTKRREDKEKNQMSATINNVAPVAAAPAANSMADAMAMMAMLNSVRTVPGPNGMSMAAAPISAPQLMAPGDITDINSLEGFHMTRESNVTVHQPPREVNNAISRVQELRAQAQREEEEARVRFQEAEIIRVHHEADLTGRPVIEDLEN